MTNIRAYSIGDEPVAGYRLIAFLGSGGFGEVWRASAPGGTEVAIKIVNLGMKGAHKEFRSLKLINRIVHPNLVPLLAAWLRNRHGEVLEEAAFDDAFTSSQDALRGTVVARRHPVGRDDDRAELVIAMGLGRMSLADRLEECKRQQLPGIPVGELLNYMQDAARAIDYLNSPHDELGMGSKAIQHCDIKPSNILIVGDAAQVCDFSLARETDDVRMTTLAGSLAFVAPEVLETTTPSRFTDQYSLAVSYVELRTGELPFPRDATQATVMNAHLNSKLDLSRLDPAERGVIKKATSRNPTDRFPSASDMVQALRLAVAPSIRVHRRRLLPWIAAACAVIVLSVAAAASPAVQQLFARLFVQEAPLPEARLPKGFIKAVDSEQKYIKVVGMTFPSHIICERYRLNMSFRLVNSRGDPSTSIRPFYIGENKVSRREFRIFAREKPELVRNSEWETDDATMSSGLNDQEREEWPVFNVSCVEATRFSRWLADSVDSTVPTVGNLPTVEQWDAAAGFYEHPPESAGPFNPKWDPDDPTQIGVRRQSGADGRRTVPPEMVGPMKVGTARYDISQPFQCRDMAGNGSEWTCSTREKGKELNLDAPDDDLAMIVRGRDYTAKNPLSYDEMKASETEAVCTERQPQLGFRVVVSFPPLYEEPEK